MSDRFEGDDRALPPGVTLDPKDQSELEQAFGVSSNAEELVRMNANRYSKGHIAVQRASVNPALTSTLYVGNTEVELDENGQVTWGHDVEREYKPELIELIGHPIEDATVRGAKRRAAIQYSFTSPRGGLEKDILPYADFAAVDKDAKKASAKATNEGAQGPGPQGKDPAEKPQAKPAAKPKARRARAKKAK